jgi:hypothetical protein
VSDPKARTARTPLRGRGRSQRVTVEALPPAELQAVLRTAARGGAAAELEATLGAALWLAPADAAAVGILGDVLRGLEPVSPVAHLVPLTDDETKPPPRVIPADTLKVLVPIALDLIRALGLTPQARAALGIELVPGPAPSATARGAGYTAPEPLRRKA